MSEWLEKFKCFIYDVREWQDEKLYRLQHRFNLSDLQMVWISFLLGAFLVWIF